MAVNQSTLSSTGTAGTISGAGARYVSVVTWEATAQDQHNVGDQTILECYDGTTVEGNWQADGSLDEAFEINTWSNVTATDNLTIRAAAGEGHGGDKSAGFRIWGEGPSFSKLIVVRVPYVLFDTLNLINTQTSNGGSALSVESVATNFSIRNSILSSVVTTSKNTVFLDSNSPDAMINCLLYGGYTGVLIDGYSIVTLRNLTMVDCNRSGIEGPGAGGAPTVINCVAYNSAFQDYDVGAVGWDAASSNNASGDTSVPGTSSITGITADAFTDYAGGDYSAASGGALDGVGANLDTVFTDDIIGYTRPASPDPWTIGAWEVQGAGPIDSNLLEGGMFTTTSAAVFTGAGDGTLNSLLLGQGTGTFTGQATFTGIGDADLNSFLLGEGYGLIPVTVTGVGDATLNSTLTGVGSGIYVAVGVGFGDATLNSRIIGEGTGLYSVATFTGSGEGPLNSNLFGEGVGTYGLPGVFTGTGNATLNSTINGVGLGTFTQEEFVGLGDGNLNSTLMGEGAGTWSDQAVVIGAGEGTVNSGLYAYGVGYFYVDGKPATNWQEICESDSQWVDLEKLGSTIRSCEDATGDE